MRISQQASLILFIAIIISSCSMDKTDITTVSFQVPTEFSEQGTKQLSQKWWEDFNDPKLNALIERSLTNNFSLRAALNRLQQAEARYGISHAELFPKVDGTAKAETGRTRAQSESTGNQSLLLGLTASYELDLWGRIRSLNDAAQLDLNASSMDLETAAISLSSQIGVIWYQLCEQRSRLLIIKDQIATNQKGLYIINLQFRTGKISIADVLQQQQLIESNRAEQTQLEKEIRLSYYSLNTLVGNPPAQSGTIPESTGLIELPALPKTGLPLEFIQRRPDLKSAFLAVQAADKRLGAAIAARYPAISISADINTSAESARDLFDNWFSNLAANLLAPLIDGGKRVAEVEKQRAVVQEMFNNYNQKSLEALSEVEKALIREKQQHIYIAQVDRQFVLSAKAMKQIKNHYLNGSENYQRVLTALVSTQNLAQQQISARFNLINNRIELCRALAGGWQNNEK
ncbi:efflux transporter outer membrane subunit [Desulfotalea psychrophila]|uniref:Related to outer membrane protein (OprM) n=1 Tax=Desulfotalea psychrophila (strain LSv54 / DSM 12343) TaxID=177439 RepID=Q6AJB6_DESPS|nr:efflux transporter outer membrane subunit [Desulfotalea psychrophila]CAG37564.1 related to outer membrane protein (OprM) [Desulfotalea psychrophila LSv54]